VQQRGGGRVSGHRRSFEGRQFRPFLLIGRVDALAVRFT
jgi:hypothetical protein